MTNFNDLGGIDRTIRERHTELRDDGRRSTSMDAWTEASHDRIGRVLWAVNRFAHAGLAAARGLVVRLRRVDREAAADAVVPRSSSATGSPAPGRLPID